jgi:hypothetical protein
VERRSVFDRGVPDCIAYARVLGTDAQPNIRAAAAYRYNPEVLLTRAWAEIYTTDDERKMTFEAAVEFQRCLRCPTSKPATRSSKSRVAQSKNGWHSCGTSLVDVVEANSPVRVGAGALCGVTVTTYPGAHGHRASAGQRRRKGVSAYAGQ